MKAHFILYVRDQVQSAAFYARVLDMVPSLNVPGMTEFTLNDGAILGLMPDAGAQRLLGAGSPDITQGHGIPRAELYLVVDSAQTFHLRALTGC